MVLAHYTLAERRSAFRCQYLSGEEAWSSDIPSFPSLLQSSYQYVPKLAAVSVYPSGMVAEHLEKTKGRFTRGIRGAIYGFSRASKRRLNEKLVQLDFSQPGWYFITLTYPGDYPEDARRWKVQLGQFRRKIEVYRPALRPELQGIFQGAIWRMERQKRGAPHFHLLVKLRGNVDLVKLQEWTRVQWTKVLGGPPRNANWVRTEVQPVELQGRDGVAKLLHYLAKYLGKRQDRCWLDGTTGEIKPVGRMWGEWGELPYAQPIVYELSAAAMATFARRLRKWGRKSRLLSRITVNRLQGVFFGEGDRWQQLLIGLASDSSPPFKEKVPF